MTVIPFDHGRRKSSDILGQHKVATPSRDGETPIPLDPGATIQTDPDSPIGMDGILSAPTGRPGTLQAACLRIDTLERALITALRENATNWARAEHAERLLVRQDDEDEQPRD